MLLLGLDFETTGLDPEQDRIIEIGAVLWDSARQVPVKIFSELVREHDDPQQLSAEIEQLTGISTSDWLEWGIERMPALGRLREMAIDAEAIVAHNGKAFDRPFLQAALRPLDLVVDMTALPWIDTLTDVPYPPHIGARKLSHLAAEHGFVSPWSHRAVFDVLTMLRVLSHYDLTEVFSRSQQPDVTLVARVTFQTNALAKARRFRFHPPNKTWLKTVKEADVPGEILLAQQAGFEAAPLPSFAPVV